MKILRFLSIFSLLVICVYSWRNFPIKSHGIKSVLQLPTSNIDSIDTSDPSYLSSLPPPPPPRSSGEWMDWDQDRSLEDEFRNSDDFDDSITIRESNRPSMKNNNKQSLNFNQVGFEDGWVEDPPYFDDVDDEDRIISWPNTVQNVNRSKYSVYKEGKIFRSSLRKYVFEDVPEKLSELCFNFISNETSISKLDAKVTVQLVLLIALLLTQLYVIINL